MTDHLTSRAQRLIDEHGQLKAPYRAAIREVAVWLSEHAGGTRAAWLLEREAER